LAQHKDGNGDRARDEIRPRGYTHSHTYTHPYTHTHTQHPHTKTPTDTHTTHTHTHTHTHTLTQRLMSENHPFNISELCCAALGYGALSACLRRSRSSSTQR